MADDVADSAFEICPEENEIDFSRNHEYAYAAK